MTQTDEIGSMIERGPSDEGRKPWLQGIAIGMTPERWDWYKYGYEPEPGYGLDGYPLQLEINRLRREGAKA